MLPRAFRSVTRNHYHRVYNAYRPRAQSLVRHHIRTLTSRLDAALREETDLEIETSQRDLPQHAVISTFDLFSIGGMFWRGSLERNIIMHLFWCSWP